MKQLASGLVVLLSLLVAPAFAQPGPGGRPGGENLPKGIVAGQVFDADLNQPIEYASVVLHRQRDSSQVTGGVTRADGRFTLTDVPPGRFYLDISFIGYRPRAVTDIQLAPGVRVDVGRIDLRQVAVAVEGVEATADRPTLSYRIDKKVIEVGRQAAAISGTAVDVIENAPSVNVDVEGNVTLRGSSNFTVLIDGRPTLLESDEALQQTPASSIERVEIITNPSAKFDPEGTSGIINLILKKQRQTGLSGQASATGGLWGRYGGDLLLNWRAGITSLLFGLDYNRRASPGTRTSEQWTADTTGDTTWLLSDGESNWGGGFGGARLGAELQWTGRDRTVIGSRFGLRSMGRSGTTGFERFSSSLPADTARYANADTSNRAGNHLSLNVEQRHRFGTETRNNGDAHEIAARFEYSRRGHDSRAVTVLTDSTGALASGWRSEGSGPGDRWMVNLDYTLPLGRESDNSDKFEAGYQAALGGPKLTSSAEAFVRDSGWVSRPDYSYRMEMANDVHSLYSTLSGHLGPLGYKAGLRGEYTDRNLLARDSVYGVRQLDIFPTAHLSYRLTGNVELMASYARRIRRPMGWELFPFLYWQDAYNVRQGNPGLLPERINSVEAGATVPFGANRVSIEAYLRTTTDLMEDISEVYSPEVILHRPANVGSDRSLGIELSSELIPFKWWTINLTANTFDYALNSAGRERTSFNWGGRLSNDFRLPWGTRVQVNAGYRSPTQTSQGRTEGFLTSDVGVRQQLFGRRLSLALSARDLFGSSSHDFTAGGEGYNFYTRNRLNRAWPSASLSVTWNFNNFRLDRRLRQDSGDSDDFGGEGDGF